MQPMARINQEIVCKAIPPRGDCTPGRRWDDYLRHRRSLSFRCVRFTWFEAAGPIEWNRAWVTAHPSLTLSNSASGGESRLQKHNLRVADRPAQSKDRRSLAAVVPAYPRGIPLRQDPY